MRKPKASEGLLLVAALMAAGCKDYVGPLGGEPPAPVGSAVSLTLGGINSATGERVANSASRCPGLATGTCVECRGVVLHLGVSGSQGSTAVLDSARYVFAPLTGSGLAQTVSMLRGEVRDLWGTVELAAGGTYTSQGQTLVSDQAFTVRRTLFFRSGAPALRDSAVSNFTCQ